MANIQTSLGKNLRKLLSTDTDIAGLSDTAAGQSVVDSVRIWLDKYLEDFNGSELTISIYSENLRAAVDFSAYNARLTYLLGKVTLLSSQQRRCIVRTQIIEYGAICEGILLDLIQSVGTTDKPSGKRPAYEDRPHNAKRIDWALDGLFRTKPGSSEFVYRAGFAWLIDVAAGINAAAFGGVMKARLTRLRRRRNLIHNATANHQRYTDDLDAAKDARESAVDLAQRCLKFKQRHRLPLP